MPTSYNVATVVEGCRVMLTSRRSGCGCTCPRASRLGEGYGLAEMGKAGEVVERVNEPKYLLVGDGQHEVLGYVMDAVGLYTPPVEENPWRFQLRGCTVEGRLRECVANAGGKRSIVGNCYLMLLDVMGSVIGDHYLPVLAVEVASPSRLWPGLTDLTMRSDCYWINPESERVWELLRTGHLAESGMWHDLSPEGKDAWLRVAVNHQRHSNLTNEPPGMTYELDGRHIVDEKSFFCALGEAINGPCGYFGMDLDGLRDCFNGGFGGTAPFMLNWHDSQVARAHLTRPYAGILGNRPAFEMIVDELRDHRVEVNLLGRRV
jgi:RNAse (barnase) inhibitor barstar